MIPYVPPSFTCVDQLTVISVKQDFDRAICKLASNTQLCIIFPIATQCAWALETVNPESVSRATLKSGERRWCFPLGLIGGSGELREVERQNWEGGGSQAKEMKFTENQG